MSRDFLFHKSSAICAMLDSSEPFNFLSKMHNNIGNSRCTAGDIGTSGKITASVNIPTGYTFLEIHTDLFDTVSSLPLVSMTA
jgi:hypothetical protein